MIRQEIIYMSSEDSKAIYFISVASTLSGIHQQTIRTYEQKGLIKPFRTGGGTRRYSQEDVDRLIQIQNLSQRGINLDGIKIIYEMKEKIEELQRKIISLESEISNQKTESKTKEKEIHQSYKNEIVKKNHVPGLRVGKTGLEKTYAWIYNEIKQGRSDVSLNYSEEAGV